MARGDLRKILVVDLEATCWRGRGPEASEVIEFGCALFDTSELKIVESFSWLTKPTKSEVSAFCTELTTITPEMVADQPSYKERCKQMRKYMQENKISAWGSWGDYDRVQLQRQCNRENVRYPFDRTHINLKHLYAMAKGQRDGAGLTRAIDELGLQFKGTHHRGVDDAINTARVLRALLRDLR